MAENDRYSFGPFRLDIERFRILRDGRPVRWWSRRRFELLKILIDAGDEVVTYETLATTIWAGNDIVNHTINRTANDLKDCLGEYADCVQNQHGIGFYFQRPPTAPAPDIAADLDIEALTLYGLGVEDWNRRTASSLQRAVGRFREVLERYPEFIPALLGLADCLGLLGHDRISGF